MTIIARLQVENYKRIRAVEIVPGEGATFIPLIGENDQGKSSILDAIVSALGGKSYLPSRPVRDGEDEGAILLELSNGLTVRRIFDADGGGELFVESADGARYPSPQAVVDKLYSSISFDPIAFTKLEPAKQLNMLRGLVQLDVDVDALREANKADYDARRDVNRDVARLSAEVDRLTLQAPKERPEPVDDAALVEQLQKAAATNSEVETSKVRREEARKQAKFNRDMAANLRTQAAELIAQAEDREKRAADVEQMLAAAEALPEPVDTEDLARRLEEAHRTNAQVRNFELLANAAKELLETKNKSATFTTAMEQREQEIAGALARAKMPVEGLSFGDGEVLFNGLPLDQASSAQQLRVSTAIGMALAPDLRVMLVRDASLLDKHGYGLLASMAKEAKPEPYQFWVEAVDDGTKVGVVIVDGRVKDAPEPAPIDKGGRRKRKGSGDPAKGAQDEPGEAPEPETMLEGPGQPESDSGAPEASQGDLEASSDETVSEEAPAAEPEKPAEDEPAAAVAAEPEPKPAAAGPAIESLFE